MTKENSALLDFGDAIRAVAEGKKITKKEWNNESTFGFMANSQLCIRKPGEKEDDYRSWMVNEGDLVGKDWYVLN